MGDAEKPASAGTDRLVRKTSQAEEKLPVEQWEETCPHPHVSAKMARIEMGWPIGFEVTRVQYLAACEQVATTPIGYRALGMTGKAG